MTSTKEGFKAKRATSARRKIRRLKKETVGNLNLKGNARDLVKGGGGAERFTGRKLCVQG